LLQPLNSLPTGPLLGYPIMETLETEE
jgi:hypothetical protein